MKTRTITALILTLICIPILLLSDYVVYPLFISLLSVVAIYEIMKCIGLSKNYTLLIPTSTIAAAMPIITYFMGSENIGSIVAILFILSFLLMLYYFTLAVIARGNLKFFDVSAAYVFASYVTVSFTALTAIRYIPNGVFTFVLVFLGAWSCDTFAYLFGSRFGKHKLIPEISPKKTVEGSIAGVISATLIFMLYGLTIDLTTELSVNYITLAVSGVLLSVISQIGDLIASLVKRERGIKDYGSIFPGHGGVMDRFDSILAVSVPFLIICLAFPPFS
ncbi:MAG: phosphatidate cytidylyltransferase [Clostridia bacterium]|nr:phosphatidate cytidylyltransferase [Clostridia bacterium]